MNFNAVCKAIKEVKIQGAENIAIAGVKSLKLKGASEKKLLSIRLTEPLLRNSLKAARLIGEKAVLDYFRESREKYTAFGETLVKSVVFTHCHSSSVISTLKRAKKDGQKFEVHNTETRPLFQGRKTARDLSKAGIKVMTFVDSAAGDALESGGAVKKADVMLIGCDAILKDGSVINKIGSNMFAEIAHDNKIPVYVITNAWKFSSKPVKFELRGYKEVWENAPSHVKIKNPAFEVVNKHYITAIVSELGILKPDHFVKEVRIKYPWI